MGSLTYFFSLCCSPQVHEAVPCYSECNQYSWAVEHWSPCRIHNELRPLRCGGGTQSRKIRCVGRRHLGKGAVGLRHFCENNSVVCQAHSDFHTLYSGFCSSLRIHGAHVPSTAKRGWEFLSNETTILTVSCQCLWWAADGMERLAFLC